MMRSWNQRLVTLRLILTVIFLLVVRVAKITKLHCMANFDSPDSVTELLIRPRYKILIQVSRSSSIVYLRANSTYHTSHSLFPAIYFLSASEMKIVNGKILVKYSQTTAIHMRLQNQDDKGEEVFITQIMEIFDSDPDEKMKGFHFERYNRADPDMSCVQLKEQSGFCFLVNEFDDYEGFWSWINSKPIPFEYVRNPKTKAKD